MSTLERRLRIGVLGCGPIAQAAHLEACRKAANAELYAICDVADDPRTRMEAIHQPHVAYKDYDAMLADPQVEAVIVATADQFHVPLALKAIAAGKHVLIEKPLGVTVDECEDLRDRLRSTPRVVQIGFNKRFDPGIAFARHFIQEEIGDMLALKAWYGDSTYRYTMTDNLQPLPFTSAQSRHPEGNPKADRQRYLMLTHGSHLIDTARFLGGEIASVRARLASRFGAYCWFVEAEFSNGALGHLDLTIAIQGDWTEGFQVYGAQGSVTGKTYLPWFHKASDVECFSASDGLYRRPLGADAHTYKRQIEGFASTILTGAPLQGAGIDDGVAGMRAMVAIARAVDSGESIQPAHVTGGL